MLIEIRGLKRIKLTKKTDAKQESTMLVLWLLGFVVHDPVSGLVQSRSVLLSWKTRFALIASFETGLCDTKS